MRMTNGVKYYTDFENPDMDGDGMLDGKEIIRCDGRDGFFYMRSDPLKTDTDGDGIPDKEDPEPNYFNDFEKDIEVSGHWNDYKRGEGCISMSMRTHPHSFWKDIKMKIQFDNPKAVIVTKGKNPLEIVAKAGEGYFYNAWYFV